MMNRHLLSSTTLQDFSENAFGRRTSLTTTFTSKKRPKICIHLEDQPDGFHVPSYTTRDRIHGHVSITSSCDLTFDDLHISMQGTSRTWVEKIATTAPTNPRTRAFHTFLRLLQPIEEEDLPENKILRAGQTYKLPFEFVVPERLLPQSCSHSRSSALVEEEHLKLPPSLGDAMVSGDGKTLHCDFAPEMTTITYSIRVVITKKAKASESRPTILGDNQLKLRIIPHLKEAPPLEVTNDPGEDYIMKRCKNIKKGLLVAKTRVGAMTIETTQPPPLQLPSVRVANETNPATVMTMVTLKIRFDPLKSMTKPPKLQMLWSRLKVATFFSTVPQKSLPSRSAAYGLDQNKGLMVDTVPLSSRNLSGQMWTKHKLDRRDSAVGFNFDLPSSPEMELSENPLASAAHASLSPATTPTGESGPCDFYYTADVLVPVELPYQKHAFVPTFHSCLVSRVYALDMSLTASAGAGNSQNFHLKAPVQVTSVGSDNPVSTEGMIPEGGFASARQEMQDVFAPNMAFGSESPPDFDHLPAMGGRRATYDLGVLGQHTTPEGNGTHDVDSDGEYRIRRNNWTGLDALRASDPASLAAELDRTHLEPDDRTGPRVALSRATSPSARSPTPRSPSPRHARLTNDEILNTEEYEQRPSAEEQFGTFHWEPVESPLSASMSNIPGTEPRRASQGLPPGYASVAAGTMLMGTGGMVRALS